MRPMELILYSMLSALQPNHMDTESPTMRDDRMMTIAYSIAEATRHATCTGEYQTDWCKPISTFEPDEHAMYLFTAGQFESGYAQHIHEDKCRIRKGECDGGLAKSLFQVHATGAVSRELWRKTGGVDRDSTGASAWAASLAFSTVQGCGTPERVFAGYMTSRCGSKRVHAHARKRAMAYRRHLAKYRSILKNGYFTHKPSE